MIETREFYPIDITLVDYQDEQQSVRNLFTIDLGFQMKQCGEAYTIVNNGVIVGVGGYINIWDNRCQLWAVIGRNYKPAFLHIHRATKNLINTIKCDRIECAVSTAQVEGNKWVESLGFKREGLARKYMPDGRDCYLYSIVR